ncbi:MAG: UxaA family hydrolase [Chloroflexi bacterium]|nr:UxaA family hydrolase [Chloroflexota bacterium]MCC6891668.1 UxaA family hydrolase [Anaerolineae bacterium]
MSFKFETVGRLPHPQDNVAIATRRLDAGTLIQLDDSEFVMSDTLLEGHRFAVRPISKGEFLLSWAQPFGLATVDIAPGTYIRNQGVLRELSRRPIDFTLPSEPNFDDEIPPFVFDEKGFQPTPPLMLYPDRDQRTFMGYPRVAERGVGTRNMIVLLGTSALTGGFVRALETRLQAFVGRYPNIDGIVAVAHTEGGHDQPNNRELLLRTLAGFMVNPNVGALLAVDRGGEAVDNAALRQYLVEHNYPLADLPHQFISLTKSFQEDMDTASAIVEGWLDTVNVMSRSPQPVSKLKIGLQCGGSDAFSGISGNPLLGWVTKEILHYGGSANLAETDELIGAESYVLDKVKDLATAQKFVRFLERFKEWAGWHGHSAEGNPSGGNLYRGLYNIYLKSLGASTKKNPDVRLDYVIDYGELMPDAGFYFMDSPGNDLESIAGQIASGCNMIFFVTGNGSITNFPYVPTIKIVTTTHRYDMLRAEMDVNAGAYLDDTPMDVLGAESLQLTIDIASGQLSAGEKAGHSQVQIWRDWKLTSPANLQEFAPATYSGEPLPIKTDVEVPQVSFEAYRTASGWATENVGLILPTSLCSGQIARMCVQQLNKHQSENAGISRFVTLVHTEGCGSSSGSELTDTLLGYLQHPMIKHAMLLEHGCEKTHNGYIRQLMSEKSLDPQDYGWASVQMDGGIQNVIRKMSDWFTDQASGDQYPQRVEVGMEGVRLGLIAQCALPPELTQHYAHLVQMIVAGGGTVVIAENDPLLNDKLFVQSVFGDVKPMPTLDYAQPITKAGFHIMFMPSRQWGEILTGLGAGGIELILAHVDNPMAGHPLLPVLQVGSTAHTDNQTDLDATYDPSSDWAVTLLNLVVETLARRYTPHLSNSDNTQFQITRGLLGVSL